MPQRIDIARLGMFQIVRGDDRVGVGIDDEVVKAVGIAGEHGHAGEAVPLDELLSAKRGAFGVADVQNPVPNVVGNACDHRHCRARADHQSGTGAGQAEPDEGGEGENGARAQHGVHGADRLEERNQHEATGRSAEQIEEIDAVNHVGRFGDHRGNDDAGDCEWRSGTQVDQDQNRRR